MGNKPKVSEFEIIRRFFAPLAAGEPGAFELTDDAAVLNVEAGHHLVVTTDTIIAGTHFPHQTSPELIAAKLLGVNLSDLASMGARPLAYTLSAALPKDVETDWIEKFSKALATEQASFKVTLIGGDTVAIKGPLTLTICAMGTVAKGQELRRSAALPGDAVYVSGTIGDAALGLRALRDELPDMDQDQREALIERFHRPRPRVELGSRLIGLAHAATDISDGLVADLGNICSASNTGATIEMERVPLSDAVRKAVLAEPGRMETVLTGGDDYELLFTAPHELADILENLSDDLALPLTCVGRITAERGGSVKIIDWQGAEIALIESGYHHF